MNNWIELAQSQMEKGVTVKAFFYLSLEAIKQLTLIAEAQKQIADSSRKLMMM